MLVDGYLPYGCLFAGVCALEVDGGTGHLEESNPAI